MDQDAQQQYAVEKPSFDEIWTRSQRRLWLYCVKAAREGADEAFAQAAYSAFVNYSACSRNSEAWLMRVTKNACTDYHRRRARARTDQLLGDDDAGIDGIPALLGSSDPERTAIGRESATILVNALAAMPDRLLCPLLLTAIEGLSYPDVAQRLGIREDSLRKRISEGRKWLRKALDDPTLCRNGECGDWEEALTRLRQRASLAEQQRIPAPGAVAAAVVTDDAGGEREDVLRAESAISQLDAMAVDAPDAARWQLLGETAFSAGRPLRAPMQELLDRHEP